MPSNMNPLQLAHDDDLLQIALHLPLPPSPTLTPTIVIPTPSQQDHHKEEQTYCVKEILFTDVHLFPNTHRTPRDPRVRILMQNANGPCPLLAIANILTLRGDLVIPLGEPTVSYSFLADRLGEYLLSTAVSTPSSSSPPASPISVAPSSSSSSSPSSRNPAISLDHILTLLPTLQHGVTIDPRFDHVTSIATSTSDPAPLLFSAFHIPLVHAWTCDPQDALAWSVLGPCGAGQSFNQASLLALADPPTPASRIAQAFLANSPGQITVHGLVTLATGLPPGRLYALFRNNHFYVLYKRAHGALFTLVTDEGYVDVPRVVWETLEAVDGESKMCSGEFQPWDPQQEQREEEQRQRDREQMARDHVPLALLGVGHGHGGGRHMDAGSVVGTLSSRSGTAEMFMPQHLQQQPQVGAGFESEQERADREYAMALQQAEDAAATLPVSPLTSAFSTRPASPSRRPSINPETRAQQSAPVYMDPSEVAVRTKRPAAAAAPTQKKEAKAKDCLVM